jgi:hypothetical protein
MKSNCMFGRKHLWVVLSPAGFIWPESLTTSRHYSIVRYLNDYYCTAGNWSQARRLGFRTVKVKLEIVP